MSEGLQDVPDSTDWLATPLSKLSAVEASLRCQVCKDFYKTPMLTTCCHTFCSLCIRRALANDGRCPLCRASDQESKLRSNWSMEEAVDAFVHARPQTLDFAQKAIASSKSPLKRNNHPQSSQEAYVDSPEPKRLRTSSRLSKTRADEATKEMILLETNYASSDGVADDRQIEPNDGLQACPICNRRMKEWQIFNHLDQHTGEEGTKTTSRATTVSATATAPSFSFLTQPPKSLERLPALNYSILKDQALRKKMTEIGISANGPRSLLEKRHREWVTIWNANCDSTRPRRRNELVNDLETWERTQGNRPTMARGQLAAVVVKDKDFDTIAWASKHETSFKDLIAQARKSRLQSKKTAGASLEKPGGASQEAAVVSDAAPPPEPDVIPDSNSEDDETQSDTDLLRKPASVAKGSVKDADVIIS